MIFEGDIEWHVEDGGQALIVEIDEQPSDIGVTITSWAADGGGPHFNRYDIGDVAKLHPELAKLIAGKSRLRITVEALD
jgi:hypothetical protein